MNKIKVIYYVKGALYEYSIVYKSGCTRYKTTENLPKTAKEFLANARCERVWYIDPPIYKYTI